VASRAVADSPPPATGQQAALASLPRQRRSRAWSVRQRRARPRRAGPGHRLRQHAAGHSSRCLPCGTRSQQVKMTLEMTASVTRLEPAARRATMCGSIAARQSGRGEPVRLRCGERIESRAHARPAEAGGLRPSLSDPPVHRPHPTEPMATRKKNSAPPAAPPTPRAQVALPATLVSLGDVTRLGNLTRLGSDSIITFDGVRGIFTPGRRQGRPAAVRRRAQEPAGVIDELRKEVGRLQSESCSSRPSCRRCATGRRRPTIRDRGSAVARRAAAAHGDDAQLDV